MTKIFITGDRSVDPLNAISHVLAVVQRVNEDGLVDSSTEPELYTDSFETGVPRAVKYLYPEAKELVHSLTDEGYPALDELYEHANTEMDLVYFVHTDAFNSRVGMALMSKVDSDKLQLVVN